MDSVGQPVIVTGYDHTFNNYSGARNCTDVAGSGAAVKCWEQRVKGRVRTAGEEKLMFVNNCHVLRAGLVGCLLFCLNSAHGAAERLNILWISCEDISSHRGCYGDPVATTPNLDKLAADPRYAEQLKRLQTVCDA